MFSLAKVMPFNFRYTLQSQIQSALQITVLGQLAPRKIVPWTIAPEDSYPLDDCPQGKLPPG